jgi:bifunctional non-homologous end joining protein LigD
MSPRSIILKETHAPVSYSLPDMARPVRHRPRADAPGLSEWIRPQLTELVKEPPDGPGWLHEIKFDGYRRRDEPG